MSKKVFSSPLRHREGNEAAHGTRTDETTWHAENPDVNVTDVVPETAEPILDEPKGQQVLDKALEDTRVPFESKVDGDNFRKWVNTNHSKYAAEEDLSESGPYDNDYIKKAFKIYGSEYENYQKLTILDNPNKYFGLVNIMGDEVSSLENLTKGIYFISETKDDGKNITHKIEFDGNDYSMFNLSNFDDAVEKKREKSQKSRKQRLKDIKSGKIPRPTMELTDGTVIPIPFQENGKIDMVDLIFGETADKIDIANLKTPSLPEIDEIIKGNLKELVDEVTPSDTDVVNYSNEINFNLMEYYYFIASDNNSNKHWDLQSDLFKRIGETKDEELKQIQSKLKNTNLSDEKRTELETRLSEIHRVDERKYSSVVSNPERESMIAAIKNSNFNGTLGDWRRVLEEIPLLKKEVNDFVNHNVNEWQNEEIRTNTTKFVKDNYNLDWDPTIDDEQFELQMNAKWTGKDLEREVTNSMANVDRINQYIENLEDKISSQTTKEKLNLRIEIKNRLDLLTSEDYIPEGDNGERIEEIKKEIDEIIKAKHSPLMVSYFKRKGQQLPPKYSTQAEVDEANKKIEVLQTELKALYAPTQKEIETLSKTYNTQIENVNTLIKLHGDALGIMEKAQEYNIDLYDEAENLNIILGALGRNHNKLDIFVKSVNNSFSGFQLSAGESLEKYIGVPVYWALDKISGQNKLPQLNGKNEYEKSLQRSIERNNLSMPERITVSDIDGFGDFAEWSLRGVGDQSFTIASLILLKRPIAMTGFFLQGSGQKFDQMNQELATTPGLSYTPWQYYVSGTWAGGVEVGSEYVTARIFQGYGNRFQLGKSAKFKNGFRESMRKNFFTTKGVVRNVVDPLAEGGSELSVLFADGINDRFILNKDVNVLGSLKEEGLDVFATSVLHAGFLYKSPLIYQEISGWMKSKPTTQKFGENAKEIIKYEELAANPNIDKSTRKIYEKKIDDLVIKNNKILQLQISNIDLLTKESKTRLIDINNKIYDKKLEANKLADNDVLTEQVLEEEVQSIVNEINNLESEKDLIITEVEGDIDFDKLTEHIEKNNNTASESKTAQENNFNYQQSIYDKVKKGVINHQAFDESKITIVEKNNDLETREAWEKIVNQDITYLEMMLEEDDLNLQEIQNIQNEINKLKSTITDIDLESSQFGRHYGFVYNSVTTGQKAIIVNKDRMKTSAEGQTVLKHEWLHVVVNDIIHNTNFESETAAGLELFQYIKQEYNRQNLDKSFDETTFVKRLAEYEEDGVDIQASEVFTLLSDAFTAGDIVYNPKETSFLDKIKKYINDMLVSYGFKDLKLETAKDLYDFVKTYNTSIEKGGKGREARIVDKAIIEGKKIKREEKEARIQHSKNVDQEITAKPDLKTDFDDLVQKPDRTKKYETKEDFQQSVDFFPAYDMVVNSKKLDGLVMANVSDVIQPTQMSDFVTKVKEKIGDRLMNNFDPAINESLFGWLTGKSGGRGESIIFRAKGDVMNEYKKQVQAQSLDQDAQKMVQIEAKADASLEAFETQDLTKEKVKKVKGIKLSEKLGPTAQDINRFVKSKAVGMDVSNLNFKKLQDLTPGLTQTMFGVVPKTGNLTKQDIKNAQMFINKNADVLKAMLPEGSTASGTSTGVQKVLLDAFYTKSDRTKAAKTGSKAGLAVQIKNQNIQTKDFLEVFGITERGKENTYKKDSNTSSRIKALIAQTGRMMTNQAVREHLIERQESVQTIQKLSEGKSDIMFSKDSEGSKKIADNSKVVDNIIDNSIQPLGEGIIEVELIDKINRGHINKVLDINKVKPIHTYDTLENINTTIREYSEVVIPTLNEQAAAFGIFNKSDRHIPEKLRKKLIKNDDGKQVTIRDIYFEKINKLFKSETKPNFGKPFDGPGAKYKYGIKYGKQFGSTPIEIQNAVDKGRIISGSGKDAVRMTPQQVNEMNVSMGEQFWQRIHDSIRSNKENARIWGNYLSLVGNNTEHPHRMWAEFIGWTINPKGHGKKLYEWEHAMMATPSYLYLMHTILSGGDFNTAFQLVKQNYKLLALDNYDDKVKLKGAGRMHSMGENWTLLDNWFDRYFHEVVAAIEGGIDPAGIMTIQGRYLSDMLRIAADGNTIGIKPGVKSKIQSSKAINKARLTNKDTEVQGITVLDFDDTLATTKSKVLWTAPDGTTGSLNAEEYASTYQDLAEQGYKFDFSEFNKVVDGKPAPLLNKAKKLAGKFGTKNMFILTARPQQSAVAIQVFLKENGLNIPLKNITGLGNSTSEAKALWMADKVAEGYNDFYFADDALQNVQAVQNMLDQFDIKSKVQQAKIQFSKKMESTVDEILDDPQLTKVKNQSSINDVKDVSRLSSPGVYSNIKFSKKHRGEYENLISKHRPDLVKEGLVTQNVDRMFDLVNGLDVPVGKKRKYEKIMTKWLATSVMKLPEDNYKLQDAVELAEKNNLDLFAYNNPNEIIEAYAGKAKAKPTDPNTVKEFAKGTSVNKEHGITEHVVENTKEGMISVRKVVDTHWGPKSNPWCIIARSEKQVVEPRQYGYELAKTKQDAQARKQQLESEGFIVEIRDRGQNIKSKKEFQYDLSIKEVKEGPGIMEDAWHNWRGYEKGPKSIVFQNGKLIAFKADYRYWDRMDNPTDAPVITMKEGRVTKKVELVPIGEGKVQEFVMETKTVSKDKNTVTTEYATETEHYEAGTTVVENRVNGITVKKTTSRPSFDKQGNDMMQVIEVVNYNKKGKATSNKNFEDGQLIAINTYGRPFGETKPEQIIKEKGDQIEFMDVNRFGRSEYFAESFVGGKIVEIGFELGRGVKLESVIKTSSDGKIRVNLNELLKVDPNVKGLPRTTTGSSIQFSKKTDADLNQILEESMNVDAKKRFSAAQAKIRGTKFKIRGLVPASAQDFMGLMYNFVGKGKQGDQHLETLKKALVDPFARGIDELNASRQSSAEDYRALLKEFPEVKTMLNQKVGDTGFTVDQAIRVYLWNKAEYDVPGLSARDLKTLDGFVKEDGELIAFADALSVVSKKSEGYSKPGEYWLTENISSDLMSDGAVGDARAEFLAEWIQNKNIIFSEENLNKVEAIYGSKFREALEDVLYAMETGNNRPKGGGRLLNEYMNWVNGSVGAIMFFNIRSAVLQTISATNYINWSDNNPLKAAAAFANQKQFWSDFVMLFNSDYLKQRRSGNRRGINEAELSRVVVGVDPVNQAKAAIRYLLKIGFLPTQIADSFAIASGGSSFYRNRVNTYVKQGMSKTEAEAQAFLDFQETTEVSQQSARPDMISQQQRNPLGRIILAFANTPMQYGRIMDKAFRDIANGRGDTKTHVSKIIYYGAIQAVIFTALQNALFAVIGSEDDDEKEDMMDKKSERMLNSMIDTWLTTFGYGGKAIGTIKNTIIEYDKQRDRDVDDEFLTRSDHAYTLLQALSFSPPISSKLRKIYQSIQTEKFNRDLLKDRGFKLDNPVWSMIGNVVEATTNIPLGRLSKKLLNIDNAMDSRNQMWQRVALILGWSTWDVGIKDPDLETLKLDVKEQKKQEKELEKQEAKEEKLKLKYPGKTEEEIDVIVKSKELFSLSKQTQIDILESLDVSDKDIKKLKKEKDRTDYIANKYKDNSELIDKTIETSKSKPKPKKKEKVELSKSEQHKKDLFKLKKKEQINKLLELGYSPRKVNSLKYEKDRVKMIIKLESKKSK